jgi:hypothetical protein
MFWCGLVGAHSTRPLTKGVNVCIVTLPGRMTEVIGTGVAGSAPVFLRLLTHPALSKRLGAGRMGRVTFSKGCRKALPGSATHPRHLMDRAAS